MSTGYPTFAPQITQVPVSVVHTLHSGAIGTSSILRERLFTFENEVITIKRFSCSHKLIIPATYLWYRTTIYSYNKTLFMKINTIETNVSTVTRNIFNNALPWINKLRIIKKNIIFVTFLRLHSSESPTNL